MNQVILKGRQIGKTRMTHTFIRLEELRSALKATTGPICVISPRHHVIKDAMRFVQEVLGAPEQITPHHWFYADDVSVLFISAGLNGEADLRGVLGPVLVFSFDLLDQWKGVVR